MRGKLTEWQSKVQTMQTFMCGEAPELLSHQWINKYSLKKKKITINSINESIYKIKYIVIKF